MSCTLRIDKIRTKSPASLNERFWIPPIWRRSGILLTSVRFHRRTAARNLVSNGHLQFAKTPLEEFPDLTHDALKSTKDSGLFDGFVNLCKSWINQVHADVKEMDPELINSQIKKTMKQVRMVSLVMPVASTSSGVQSLIIVTKAISSFISVYLLLLFVRVLLSWFPTFKWDRNPWIILRQVTDPYLNLFRGLIPPLLGTIDFTPLLGFIILQWLSGVLIVSEEEEYW